jgi:O-acetyl-ADP-ribose deacetylase (regulator of RNase III)
LNIELLKRLQKFHHTQLLINKELKLVSLLKKHKKFFQIVKQESTGVYRVDPDNLTWYMINAVKELDAEVQALRAELNQLKGT